MVSHSPNNQVLFERRGTFRKGYQACRLLQMKSMLSGCQSIPLFHFTEQLIYMHTSYTD